MELGGVAAALRTLSYFPCFFCTSISWSWSALSARHEECRTIASLSPSLSDRPVWPSFSWRERTGPPHRIGERCAPRREPRPGCPAPPTPLHPLTLGAEALNQLAQASKFVTCWTLWSLWDEMCRKSVVDCSGLPQKSISEALQDGILTTRLLLDEFFFFPQLIIFSFSLPRKFNSSPKIMAVEKTSNIQEFH